MIVTQDLTKTFHQVAAVRQLNLHIAAGDIFGFIGPNGAGKTTTIKMLATLLRPSAGQVFINGWAIDRYPEKVRPIIGYMPDFFGAYEGMRVHEYLEFFAAAYNIRGARRQQVVDDILELTELRGQRDHLIDELSRGLQQRLSLARVLIHDPKVLLLDEPAAGLDPVARIEMRELLQELQRMGKTILISSHILPELGMLCNKIGIIVQGQLLYCGSLDELTQRFQQPKVVLLRLREDGPAVERFLRMCEGLQELSKQADTWRLTFRHPDFDIGLLPKFIVQQGFTLTYLSEAPVNLEDVFMQITQGAIA